MEPTPITLTMSVFQVTEQHPETLQVLLDIGLSKMRDPQARRTQGQKLTVEAAARLKQLDPEELLRRLREASGSRSLAADVTLRPDSELRLRPEGDIALSGLLPCPVRLPIVERVGALARELEAEQGVTLGYSLAAASVGADSLLRQLASVRGPDELPDLFVSAGFETFFDERSLRRFKDRGLFADLAPPGVNRDFADLDLRDPEGHFSVLGVVPAVFLVNHEHLGDAPAPRTWADLLGPAFERRVALPVADFDLMNGLMLTLDRRFGPGAVEALARSMVAGLHPSQAVGRFANRRAEQPAVSIVPYFFSRMLLGNRTIQVVWPEDGAVVVPIFMLCKREAPAAARQVAELFLSREIGEVLAHRGLFPVLHPEVDNRLPEGARFQWLGWPAIKEQDLGAWIPRLQARFQAALSTNSEPGATPSPTDSEPGATPSPTDSEPGATPSPTENRA